MSVKTRRYVTTDPTELVWRQGLSGPFTIVRNAYKLVGPLSGGQYIAEQLGSAGLPIETLGVYETLDDALDRIDTGPAYCRGCGHRVVPGYEVPDPTLPCPL